MKKGYSNRTNGSRLHSQEISEKRGKPMGTMLSWLSKSR